MRQAPALSALLLVLGLGACATSSGPAPLVVGGASSAATGTSTIQRIGQCDPAFPDAMIAYPRGWNDRLARVEETAVPNAEDELLGGSAPARKVSVNDRDAQPVRPPMPTYPKAAIAEMKEGVCQILLDVTPDGKPTDMVAACSDPVFAGPSLDAMRSVRFAPMTEGGNPVARQNVIYPLTYCVE